MKQQIIKHIEEVLKHLDISDVEPQVDYPTDPKHGDYTTNVAMIAAKKLDKNPREFASELSEKLQSLDKFEKVEVAGPGFINFWVKDEVLIENAMNEKKGNGVLAGKKIMVEYTDPNPFKEFHIGHLYSNIVGESLCRILEANGATVQRVDYFGDVGMHVSKALFGLQSKLKTENLELKLLEGLNLKERIKYMGEAYALGATAYEENTDAKTEMQELNRLIYIAAQRMWKKEKGLEPQVDYQKDFQVDEDRLDEIYKLYTTGREWSLAYFETIYQRLGTKFDGYYPESIAGERGYKLVKDNLSKGIFAESEGAIVFLEEKSGLHTRVFINKLGLPTYEAKELGLAPWKYEEFPYDQSIIVTGNEINEYFKVLITALKQINPGLGEKAKHLSHGMVKLPEGKMSSRTGKIVTGEWLLDEAKSRALKLSDSEEVAEQVGIGAVKYALLKNGIGKDVEFSFDESVSFEGNSGPYLQYTYARTRSVLAKGKGQKPEGKSADYTLNPEERELLQLLVRFGEVVEEAAVRYAPSAVATYLFELAQAFNLFYQKHQILKAEDAVKQFRLVLTATTGDVLKQGLNLLGIQAPDRM